VRVYVCMERCLSIFLRVFSIGYSAYVRIVLSFSLSLSLSLSVSFTRRNRCTSRQHQRSLDVFDVRERTTGAVSHKHRITVDASLINSRDSERPRLALNARYRCQSREQTDRRLHTEGIPSVSQSTRQGGCVHKNRRTSSLIVPTQFFQRLAQDRRGSAPRDSLARVARESKRRKKGRDSGIEIGFWRSACVGSASKVSA